MPRISPAKIQIALDRQGLSAYMAAKYMGVSSTWVQRLLKGEIRMPTEDYLAKLERVLRVPYRSLLEDTDATGTSQGKELSADEVEELLDALRRLPPEVRHQRIEALKFDADHFEATRRQNHRLNEEHTGYTADKDDKSEEA